MGLHLNANSISLGIQQDLRHHQGVLSDAYRRLSSGLRIQSPHDDPAGHMMASKLRLQASEYRVGLNNLDGFEALVQAAAGANSAALSHFERIKELALEASDGTLTDEQRSAIDEEYRASIDEIKRIGETVFNEIQIADGSTFSVSTRIGDGANDAFSVVLPNVTNSYFNTFEAFDLDSAVTAQNLQGFIDSAISLVQTYDGLLGAGLSRISSVRSTLQTQLASTQQAENRITRLDVAAETSALVHSQIVVEGASSLLAQANLQPRTALTLLQNTLIQL
jgi:flagellin